MSSTPSNRITTKAATLAHVQALIAGTNKHLPEQSFTFGGVTYTAASLIQVFQGLVNAMNARDVAEAGAKDALAAEKATQKQAAPTVLALKRFVLLTFASNSQVLGDFGLTPPKARTPLSTAQRAARAAKAKATRAARGTTSKKQKLAVKGNVTGVTVTPVTAPTAASPPAQPVTTAPSAPPVGVATK
ncbi:MAG TPA: hypothetical protein VKU41_11765 [Polyangiaceae bacterium]|nr:hypothetical protein [Polyangiaceae bacterium]